MRPDPSPRRRHGHQPSKRELLDQALAQTRKAKGPVPDFPQPEPEPEPIKRLT